MHPLLAAFDAEDSPGAVATRKSENIHRDERRFLITTGDTQRQALADRGILLLRTYHVRTLYVDTKDLSWSIGTSQVKFRLRQYNDDPIWWFEIKTNTQGNVDKHRRQVSAAEIDSLGLKPVVVVSYSREEYETGADALKDYEEGAEDALARWLRVTIDTDVTAVQVPRDVKPSVAMQAPGKPLATLTNRVLEVKSGAEQVPSWLPLPMEWKGSKSRFAVSALYGLSNMWAPSYDPAVGPPRAYVPQVA